VATSSPSIAKSDKYGDLRHRLIFLMLALVVYRIGAHIPVPGIDPNQLAQLFKTQEGGILSLFNMFSGGALSRFAVFALGIMPYISASIIMQLGSYVVPALEQMKKEGGSGPQEDHAVHTVWHSRLGPVSVPWHCAGVGRHTGFGH
jgi:preprotein translocase subunit SecY